MQENIRHGTTRGANLGELQERTEALSTQATVFRKGANRVRKQMWWKDMKMRMCIIVGIIVLLLIIIIPSGTKPDPPAPRLVCPLEAAGEARETNEARQWLQLVDITHFCLGDDGLGGHRRLDMTGPMSRVHEHEMVTVFEAGVTTESSQMAGN